MESRDDSVAEEGERVVFTWSHLDENPAITLCVRTLAGVEYPLTVHLRDTLDELRQKMEAAHGIPKCQQKYIYGGKDLAWNDRTVEEYGMQEGGLLHLILNLRC